MHFAVLVSVLQSTFTFSMWLAVRVMIDFFRNTLGLGLGVGVLSYAVTVRVRVRVRFAFCSLQFEFQFYRVLGLGLGPGSGSGLDVVGVRIRVRIRVRLLSLYTLKKLARAHIGGNRTDLVNVTEGPNGAQGSHINV